MRVAAAVVAVGLVLPATAVAAHRRHGARSWYVSAAAPPGGSGSRRAPLHALADVERLARAGDRIVVLPAAQPLDGGIALKPRQTLVGVRASGSGLAPRIANTGAARLRGDAVELADRTTVRNLTVGPSYRGGIYGSDVTGVRLSGNDVSGQNSSCTVGFVVLPFVLPTIVPGLGVPLSGGLPNGWAGIMLDAATAHGAATIAGNVVHDAACGDGIDLRLTGTADLRAVVTGNLVARLRQGQSLLSLLAIGMQVQGSARLTAVLDRNTQRDIGSVLGRQTDQGAGLPGAGADAEGVFANLAGHGHLAATITHDTFEHGIGGFSVNGMEMVITGGSPTADMHIADSTFHNGPGDMLEEINFGTDAHMSLALDRVAATHTTGLGNTYVIPGNNGDCLVEGQTGAGDVTSLRVRRSELSDCANNGLTVASGVSNGSRGPAGTLSFDIAGSRIVGNRADNLRVVNETGLRNLIGRVQDTDLRGAGLIGVAVDKLAGSTDNVVLDFGGGPLGSPGRNCFGRAGLLDAEALLFQPAMQHNWWGRPGGPTLGRTTGAVDAGRPLAAPPGACS